MSQEVAIMAIIRPAPGKLDRAKEAIRDAITWIEANEPETLEFSLYEDDSEEGVRLFMFEKYASQAAKDLHESSENYQTFFKTMTEEQLLAEAPLIVSGKHCHAFSR